MRRAVLLSFLFLFILSPGRGPAQDSQAGEPRTYTSKETNAQCLKCHGQLFYTLTDTASGEVVKKRMSDLHYIDTNAYYNSNHYDFQCFDCHTDGFKTFPHPYELRFEVVANCLDCHGGDESFAKYKFEEIEKDVNQSVHFNLENSRFSCYSCHDSHTYLAIARNEVDIQEVVKHDNQMCLKCHGSQYQYSFYATKKKPDIITKHEWLPNQEIHFQSVRCIECHTLRNDSTMVAHNIQPKEKAVKRCVECHSSNSMLLHTLYKHQVKESILKDGFVNSVILNHSYVVGANRNIFFNIFYAILVLATLAIIFGHITLRIIHRKK